MQQRRRVIPQPHRGTSQATQLVRGVAASVGVYAKARLVEQAGLHHNKWTLALLMKKFASIVISTNFINQVGTVNPIHNPIQATTRGLVGAGPHLVGPAGQGHQLVGPGTGGVAGV